MQDHCIYWRVLLSMLYQAHGTISGVLLACYYGWSINLSGGFHHAIASTNGDGFRGYVDIPPLSLDTDKFFNQ